MSCQRMDAHDLIQQIIAFLLCVGLAVSVAAFCWYDEYGIVKKWDGSTQYLHNSHMDAAEFHYYSRDPNRVIWDEKKQGTRK